MASTVSSDVAAIAKIMYKKPGSFEKALTRETPGLSMLTHTKDFATPEGLRVPIPRVDGQGFGSTAALAFAHHTAVGISQWQIPQVSYFRSLSIDGQVVQNASNGTDATQLYNAVKYNTDNALSSAGLESSKFMWGSSTGHRGQILTISIGATTTFTMTDVSLLAEGMVIVLATTAAGATRSGGTTNKATVSAINQATKTVTFTGQNFTTLFGTAAIGDYIFREGDAQNGAGSGLVPLGLEDWNPSGTISATPFCGVVRTLNTAKLAGFQYDGTVSDTLRTVLVSALAAGSDSTGNLFKEGTFFVHPVDMGRFINSVETTRVTSKEKMTKYEVGVKEYEINGHKLVADPHCPRGKARYIGEGAFALCTSGQAFSWGDPSEPLKYAPQTNAHEGLLRFYGNFAGLDTSSLGVITLPSS